MGSSMSKFNVGDRVKVAMHHPNSELLGDGGVIRKVDSRGRNNVELDKDGFNAGRWFKAEYLVLVEPDIKVGDTVWVESPDYMAPAQNGTVVRLSSGIGVSVRVTYPNGAEAVLLFRDHEIGPAREEETYTRADIDAAYQHGREDERSCWVIRVEELLNG